MTFTSRFDLPDEPENLTLRADVIARQRYADDYGVRWRGLPIGRILLGSGAPHDRPQWSWSCHLSGRPQAGDERGTGADLAGAKRRFKAAWSRIRAGLTDQDIAKAQVIAENSRKALAWC